MWSRIKDGSPHTARLDVGVSAMSRSYLNRGVDGAAVAEQLQLSEAVAEVAVDDAVRACVALRVPLSGRQVVTKSRIYES